MAYTPELSYQYSCTLRRIAWALGLPMTKAIGVVIDHFVKMADNEKVCVSCKDNTRCRDCVFNRS